MARSLRSTLLGAAMLAALAAPVAPLAAQNRAQPRHEAMPASPAPSAARHPRNVILVLLDDLRFDGMGFLQPALRTPNIDRMAREGSYFPNAVVTSSLCSPSRATILTGETARNHHVVDNNNSSEKGLIYFPSYLRDAGYQTAFIGKWHMGSDTDAPRPGFDRWVSFKGQGTYWPKDPFPGMGTTMLNVDGKRTPQTGYITDELTDYAMNWLEKERDPKKPFFLYLSHKAVHSDPLPPPRYLHQYDKTVFQLPASAANTKENYAGKPRWVYDQRNTWHGIDFFYNADVRMEEYLKYYYGALSAVDDSLGRIFTYLKKNHLEKDTLVVFTSDNGFQIGDHGLIDKRTAYEASVRVPLLVWEPGTIPAGKVNTGRVRNLDFAPTFLDLAGLKAPAQFEGQSAWGLWTGSVAAPDWKPGDFVYEYYWEYNFPETPTTFAITRDNLKYIEYYGIYDRDELYDLAADPQEMRNLADDPAHVKDKIDLRAALFRQLANRSGEHMIPYLGRESTGAVRRRIGGTGAAPFPESWYIEPNPKDRYDDLIPDSMLKAKVHAAGKPFVPTPPLIDGIRDAVQGGSAKPAGQDNPAK